MIIYTMKRCKRIIVEKIQKTYIENLLETRKRMAPGASQGAHVARPRNPWPHPSVAWGPRGPTQIIRVLVSSFSLEKSIHQFHPELLLLVVQIVDLFAQALFLIFFGGIHPLYVPPPLVQLDY